ncbi:MAG: resA 1 [Gammaproteobacteria bacterium]|jgi:peroxiredoxin|nr:resA 1 [Gammaproteobacteria bacterium]
MAETASTMLPLGTIAPAFKLWDVCTEKQVSLDDLKSTIATVIMFICNHCPYVKYIQAKLVDVTHVYQKKGIVFIAINSNDVKKYPADSPENMRKEAQAHHYTFPYLYDETQEVAKAYQAACTPDFYIFDHQLACVYRGRFDDATPGNHYPVTGKELINALDQIIANKPIDQHQLPSVGCNIKWAK